MASVQIFNSWKPLLEPEFQMPYMVELRKFLLEENKQGKTIYPKGSEIFNALNSTAFEDVRIVIVGQDPYHGPGQAHGLCFSVNDNVALPPSLQNIYKEMREDLSVPIAKTGNLTPWTKQGVLLLNAVLTVEESKAASHQNRGWEKFTDRVIELLNERNESIAFILWGKYAQKKAAFVDRKRHFVLESAHPSPLSAYNGFYGSKPFSRVNSFFRSKGLKEIDWALES